MWGEGGWMDKGSFNHLRRRLRSAPLRATPPPTASHRKSNRRVTAARDGPIGAASGPFPGPDVALIL